MLMPGRNGAQTAGGWASGSAMANGNNLPANLTVQQRFDNSVNEYVAGQNVEFVDGFESGIGHEFTAYIADGTYTPSSGGSGGTAVNSEGYRYGFNGKGNDNEIKG